MKQGSTCVVNAASEKDMAVFAAGMIKAKFPATCLFCYYKLFDLHLEFFLKYWECLVWACVNIQAEIKGKRFLCRTAASFVSACVGIVRKAPILPKDLGINKERNGGLIVVGSYVPKTTKQVDLAIWKLVMYVFQSIMLIFYIWFVQIVRLKSLKNNAARL